MTASVSDAGFDHVKKIVDELSLMDDTEFLTLMAALYPDESTSTKSAEALAKDQRKKAQEAADVISRHLAGDSKAELTLNFKDLTAAAELLSNQMHADMNALLKLMPELSLEFQQTCGLQLTSYLEQCRSDQQKLANRRNDANQAPSGLASQSVQAKSGGVLQPQLKPNPSLQLQNQLQNTMANGLTNPTAAVNLMVGLQQANVRMNSAQQSPRVRAMLQRMAATLALANIGPPTAINSPATQQALNNNPAALAQKMRNPAFVSLMQQGLDRNNPGMAEKNHQNNPNAAAQPSAYKSPTPSPFKQ